ncbi:Carbohydrate-binding X8 domain superfamily protein [Prunus dulcis]|uniref:Carbohydrate-binding X8 domain superfamily protein n=1 Tax=Prunus dulcis TaxID=3755 RepID=A0A4Y1R9W3_PRUDU|nr:Carbohydrate-binding X8 domain superfamily protein [Prunus dulcis]
MADTWCVPKPGTPDSALQNIINFTCGILKECSEIQEHGSCYFPNTLINHALFAMNLYYKTDGRYNCDFSGVGLSLSLIQDLVIVSMSESAQKENGNCNLMMHQNNKFIMFSVTKLAIDSFSSLTNCFGVLYLCIKFWYLGTIRFCFEKDGMFRDCNMRPQDMFQNCKRTINTYDKISLPMPKAEKCDGGKTATIGDLDLIVIKAIAFESENLSS